jgi:transcription elongation factor Elf1
MNKLEKPSFDFTSVFNTCISNVEDVALKSSLASCLPTIIDNNRIYEDKATTKLLHEIPTHRTVNTIDGKEIEKVYTNRMVPKDSLGRTYYNQIKSIPKFGKCPFCNQRDVSTLDHFLPKTKYPVFSVTPINLVPACSNCNKNKTANIPTKAEEVFIHPYFDDITDIIWLKAEIIENNDIKVEYYIDNSSGIDNQTKERLEYQIKILEIKSLYSSHAMQEIYGIKYMLKKLFSSGGAFLVQSHLKDCAESVTNDNKNSWKSALYKALYDSKWFHNEWIRDN